MLTNSKQSRMVSEDDLAFLSDFSDRIKEIPITSELINMHNEVSKKIIEEYKKIDKPVKVSEGFMGRRFGCWETVC